MNEEQNRQALIAIQDSAERRNVVDPILALRHNEHRIYWENEPPNPVGHVYLVAMIPTPMLPKPAFENTRNVAVICAQFRHGRWGWIHLDHSAKRVIGYDLEADEWPLNRWVWLEIILEPEG